MRRFTAVRGGSKAARAPEFVELMAVVLPAHQRPAAAHLVVRVTVSFAGHANVFVTVLGVVGHTKFLGGAELSAFAVGVSGAPLISTSRNPTFASNGIRIPFA